MQEHVALSADHTVDEADATLHPPEFLNSLTPGDLPAHKLRLRKGMPIMLIRNLDQLNGKANGTLAEILEITPNVLKVKILNGNKEHVGSTFFIPRIKLISKDAALPFQLARRQFPIKVAFAMTINKAQGQTLEHMGLYLPRPVFSHGQLYVALSRVGSKEQVIIYVVDGDHNSGMDTFTQNIVYKEIFEEETDVAANLPDSTAGFATDDDDDEDLS